MLCELLRKLQSQKETLVDLKAVKAPIHGSQTDPHTSKPGGPESCRKWLEHHITRRSMEYDGIIFEFCVCVCCTFCRVVFFSICGSHILAPDARLSVTPFPLLDVGGITPTVARKWGWRPLARLLACALAKNRGMWWQALSDVQTVQMDPLPKATAIVGACWD